MDLSIGTPVDPVPEVIRDALTAASNSPGYPQTKGTANCGQPRPAGSPAGMTSK